MSLINLQEAMELVCEILTKHIKNFVALLCNIYEKGKFMHATQYYKLTYT